MLGTKRRSGSVYMPQFNAHRRSLHVTVTAPARTTSVYDLEGAFVTEKDMRKPSLLGHVVREEQMKSIVNRLTRPTLSSTRRSVGYQPQCQYTFVDMGRYQWNRMDLYTDYQRHMYTSQGCVQPHFRRTVKAAYVPLFY